MTPEYNVTGQDYSDRRHFRYAGPPIIDIHAHVLLTRPGDPPTGPPLGTGPGATAEQAVTMLDVAADFGVGLTVAMTPADDIPALRERLGDRLRFNGMINKKSADEPDEVAYQLLDRYLREGAQIIKFWAAPRGRERGLTVDSPWRIECARRAVAAGIRVFMVHVGDPDVWFRSMYADAAKYGTKPEQYVGLERMMQLFPEAIWIGAHMGGDPEHPDHLEALFEKYPNFHVDTSATKWQIREVSPRADVIRDLVCRHPTRFLFGVDLVTRHHLVREHYVSRYWGQRTLWESEWQGRSPIADPDNTAEPDQPPTPLLRGVRLPADVLEQVYHQNARRILRQ